MNSAEGKRMQSRKKTKKRVPAGDIIETDFERASVDRLSASDDSGHAHPSTPLAKAFEDTGALHQPIASGAASKS